MRAYRIQLLAVIGGDLHQRYTTRFFPHGELSVYSLPRRVINIPEVRKLLPVIGVERLKPEAQHMSRRSFRACG